MSMHEKVAHCQIEMQVFQNHIHWHAGRGTCKNAGRRQPQRSHSTPSVPSCGRSLPLFPSELPSSWRWDIFTTGMEDGGGDGDDDDACHACPTVRIQPRPRLPPLPSCSSLSLFSFLPHAAAVCPAAVAPAFLLRRLTLASPPPTRGGKGRGKVGGV